MSKLAKFFIICAAVCVVGIVLAFAGYAAGGVDNMEKVAEKHEWLNVGPTSMEQNLLTVGEFSSIEAEGSLDIAVVSPGQDIDGEDDPEFLTSIYSEGVPGSVAVKWGKGTDMPEVTNDNGVLKVKGSMESIEGVGINLNSGDPSPDVVIFCGDKELESISINGKYGDISIDGIKAKTISVSTESGDIDIERAVCETLSAAATTGDVEAGHVACSEMKLNTTTGDIDIEGCEGNVSAEANTGDIEFASILPQSQFEINVSVDTGTISIGEVEMESENSFILPGGPNKLTLKTTTGDIDADFLED